MKVGDVVKIKDGNIDPDTGMKLDGFIGRIKEYLASNLVNIEWDSVSLQNLPDTYIRSAIHGGCDYLTYNIESKDLELCVARDMPADVIKAVRRLGEKWDKVESFGGLAEVMEEIEEEGWDNFLTEAIDFPFKATYFGSFKGVKRTDIVKVHRVHSEDDHYGILMNCKVGRITYHLPLCELDVDGDENQETLDAVDLYKEYFNSLY